MSEDSGSGGEGKMPRKQGHNGGKINIFEPPNTRELLASPLTVQCFKHVGCFDFCERLQ